MLISNSSRSQSVQLTIELIEPYNLRRETKDRINPKKDERNKDKRISEWNKDKNIIKSTGPKVVFLTKLIQLIDFWQNQSRRRIDTDNIRNEKWDKIVDAADITKI